MKDKRNNKTKKITVEFLSTEPANNELENKALLTQLMVSLINIGTRIDSNNNSYSKIEKEKENNGKR